MSHDDSLLDGWLHERYRELAAALLAIGIRVPRNVAFKLYGNDTDHDVSARRHVVGWCQRFPTLEGWICGLNVERLGIFPDELPSDAKAHQLRGLLIHESLHAALPAKARHHGVEFEALCRRVASAFGLMPPVSRMDRRNHPRHPRCWPDGAPNLLSPVVRDGALTIPSGSEGRGRPPGSFLLGAEEAPSCNEGSHG